MPRKRRKLSTLRRQSAAPSWDLVLQNDLVLTEILLRLSAKSLIRFKSVCKRWLSLISSDYLCHQHTLRRPKLQPSLIIGSHHGSNLFYFNGENVLIPYRLSKPHHYIQQDCNGLLLLISECRKEKYYVHNPTTRQSRKITLTQRDKFPYVVAITLAFDPSKSPYYKIVCVKSSTESSSASYAYRIEVYDSESHTWKLSLEPSTCPRIFNDGVHYNNSIFWRTRGHGDGDGVGRGIGGGLAHGFNLGRGRGRARARARVRGDSFCCFDIAKNEIKNLSFPPGSSHNPESFPYLQESNGHLYCFKLVKGHQSVSIQVWELGGDHDHSQWLSKHRGEIRPHCVGGSYRVRFVGGWDEDAATCSLLMYDMSEMYETPPRIMAYNFLDDSYELRVHFPDYPGCLCGGLLRLQFGETLALV